MFYEVRVFDSKKKMGNFGKKNGFRKKKMGFWFLFISGKCFVFFFLLCDFKSVGFWVRKVEIFG